MSRREFSRQVKRAALERAGGRCEASGAFYGLSSVARCYMPLNHGVEFDHVIADAIGGEPTLANCLCVCKRCHLWKSARRDTPLAAKTKRQQDKHNGIRKASIFPGSRG